MAAVVAAAVTLMVATPQVARAGAERRPPANVRITPDNRAGSFVRSDGGTDAVLERCSTGRRPQAEAGVALDPSAPEVVVVGGQTVCPDLSVSLGYFDLGWAGIYRSTDGGRSFRASVVPGYPGDTSPAGLESPAHGMRQTAEHALAFDSTGRLFYAFIACSRPRQSSCRNFVAVYDDHGATYRYTVLLSTLSPPSVSGVDEGFGLWGSIGVDRTGGAHDGRVYVTWNLFVLYAQVDPLPEQAVPMSVTMLSRSADHGRTWSPPVPVMPPAGVPYSSDVAVGPDGAVHVVTRNIGQTGPLEQVSTAVGGMDAVLLASSHDGGVTFGPPVLVDRIRDFNHARYTTGIQSENPGVCGDGYFACDTPYTAMDDGSNAVVVADTVGVHVFWNGRRGAGQSKVFVRSSLDGASFVAPARTLDDVAVGHQDRVEAVSDRGVITVTFMDSRADPSYDADRPQGNTLDGRTVAPYIDTWAAQSRDGGVT